MGELINNTNIWIRCSPSILHVLIIATEKKIKILGGVVQFVLQGSNPQPFCQWKFCLTTRPHRANVQNALVSIQTSLMVCVFKLLNGTTLGLWWVIMGTPMCEICYAKEAGE